MARRVERTRVISARCWLDRLVLQISLTRDRDDAATLHQLRAAVMRLRVWLRLGSWDVLDDDLRWLRDSAAPIRDCDVHLAREPPVEIAQRLSRERERARRDLLNLLTHPRVDGMLAALELLPGIPRSRAIRAVNSIARAALRQGRRAMKRPKDVGELHSLRRLVRQVRFGLESLDCEAEELADLQSKLGAVADDVAAAHHIDRFALTGREARSYRRQLERDLEKHARSARRAWRKTRTVMKKAARCSSS